MRSPFVLLAVVAALSLQLRASQLSLPLLTFAKGDVFVSLENGPVLWWTAAGLPRGILIPTVLGVGEGMAFDSAGNLYVTRWCLDGPCQFGNTIEKFNSLGLSQGKVGPVFNCQPHTMVFDRAGAAYVGQAACNKTILKLSLPAAVAGEYAVAEETYGVFWMDLAADGCTMVYTSVGSNVKQFDVCANAQLADFNAAPLPGGITHDVRVLPDGGVLVSSGEVIARLDHTGVLTRTYQVPGEGALWAGLDLVGDGTFWAGNYFSSNLHRFDLATGSKLATITTGVPANSIVGLRVKK
jgi:outer membrane protein assembly factor BamB